MRLLFFLGSLEKKASRIKDRRINQAQKGVRIKDSAIEESLNKSLCGAFVL
jgi:hypothetical protein